MVVAGGDIDDGMAAVYQALGEVQTKPKKTARKITVQPRLSTRWPAQKVDMNGWEKKRKEKKSTKYSVYSLVVSGTAR
jgi:hypothetical protein